MDRVPGSGGRLGPFRARAAAPVASPPAGTAASPPAGTAAMAAGTEEHVARDGGAQRAGWVRASPHFYIEPGDIEKMLDLLP